MELGAHIDHIKRACEHLDEPKLGSADGNYLLATLYEIENILRNSTLETPVTGQVVNFRKRLESDNFENGETIPEELSTELAQSATTWLHLIQRELNQEQRIPAENTGLLDPDKLLNSPEDLFGQYVWNWLDEQPRNDIIEACKTIIIGCSTSSVILSLRAVEYCLRDWYEYKNGHLDGGPWGFVLDQLMEEYTTEEKSNDTVLTQLSDLPPVLSNLYYLKEKRNEVNHPERSPDPQEARKTLMIVAATITDIFAEYRNGMMPDVSGIDVDINEDEDDLEDLIKKLIAELDEEDEEEDGLHESVLFSVTHELGIPESIVDECLQNLLYSGRIYEPTEDTIRAI
ncbi:hypothetical protein [Haloferax volcanii]|uniref:Uncharacterized protein n=1 Tax=Haloferax volcanii TaxID=2246 RepID=A0A558FQL0_HALVO|nr:MULTISPECIES: hypothetical protein [Haloferax]TVT87769.1 hypothetical protein FQA18_19250 [Haloferax volcanii]